MNHEAHTADDVLHAEVVAFLGAPATHGVAVTRVDRVDTHGAIVFLAGDDVYKIKRNVCYSYMDFSTLELRQRACARELEINRPQAPDIYLGVVAITRELGGGLAIGGSGMPVEWAVHMRRFGDDALLSRVAEQRGIDTPLARALADVVHVYHSDAPAVHVREPRARLACILAELADELAKPALGVAPSEVRQLISACELRLDAVASLLERRSGAGFVRRCHGDLHLGNIVFWQGRPTPFDAIEFDETLATIDTLYDLAFLLMDLDQRGQRTAANIVLNRYVWRSRDVLDLEGLAVMPLFLGLRAGIRAMVLLQRAALRAQPPSESDHTVAQSYLQAAIAYLAPDPPRLIAVGGLSGTGKSTLAAALAPMFAPAPGALHLRSDLERKSLLGAGETERLPASSYTSQGNQRVYDVLLNKARVALAAGHSVIVDAVYLAAEERNALQQLAFDLRVPFSGLWLNAPEEVMVHRVAGRTNDASDATPDVVRRQIATQGREGGGAWVTIEAGGSAEDTLRAAREILGASPYPNRCH